MASNHTIYPITDSNNNPIKVEMANRRADGSVLKIFRYNTIDDYISDSANVPPGAFLSVGNVAYLVINSSSFIQLATQPGVDLCKLKSNQTMQIVDGTGYATAGYFYDSESHLLICYGTTNTVGGDNTDQNVTFAKNFNGMPVIVCQMVGTNIATACTTNPSFRNEQYVKGFYSSTTSTNCSGAGVICRGFVFNCGNSENHYYSYIAIGRPAY